MTTAYTSLLGLALPVTGELSGTWGDTVNTAITSLLDTAIAGTTSITTDADITLSTTTGASNQARQAIILWNPASGTTTRNITAPAQSKMYTVINASGGTQSIVIRGVGPTTGVTVLKGESALVAWNGSDFVKVSTVGGSGTFIDLTVTGNTILGDAAADTLTVNATSTFNAPVSFAGLVRLPSTGRSAAAALTVTAPAFLYGVASTYTDTTSSGTIAAMAPFYSIAQPTLSTSNVTTYTNAATLYIANAPAAGGSATITNPYTLYSAAGANYFGGATTFNSTTQFNGVATHSANLLFSADNTYDIGASGATRPRTLYLSSTINIANAGYATLVNASSANAWSSGYFDIATFYVTNMTAGAVSLNVGKAAGTNNSGKIAFNYAGGSGSTANYVEFGLFNNDGLFRVYGTGNLSNVRSNASVYSGSNSATWANGLSFSNNATPATGVPNLINFNGASNVNAVFGVVQNASGYGDFVWAGYAGTYSELGRFTSAGNFGIGTSSPSQVLDVQSTVTRAKFTSTTGTNTVYGQFVNTGGGVYVGRESSTGATFGAPAYASVLWSEGAYPLVFATNNATKATLTSAGNLGVGNFTPYNTWGNSYVALQVQSIARTLAATGAGSGDLTLAFNAVYDSTDSRWEFAGTGDKAGRYSQTGGGSSHVWYVTDTNGTADAAITFIQAMTLNSSGNLLVGDNSAQYSALLYVNGSIAARNGGVDGTYQNAFVAGYTSNYNERNIIQTAVSSGSGSGFRFQVSVGGGSASVTNAMDVLKNGTYIYGLLNVAAPTSAAGGTNTIADNGSSPNNIRVYNQIDSNNTGNRFIICDAAASVLRAEIRSNGGLANYQANNVNLSDRREKTNFAPAKSYLDVVCAIPVQTFNYIDQNHEEDGGLTLGVVAQDVQAVAPELVMESNWAGRDSEPKMRLSIYQTDLQYALMKALQELNAKFDAYVASHP